MMNNDLDQIFDLARQTPPDLSDHHFTNKVINRVQFEQSAKRRIKYDVYGVIFGLIAALTMLGFATDLTQFLQSVYTNTMSVTLTLSSLMNGALSVYWSIGLASVALIYALTWWRSEGL